MGGNARQTEHGKGVMFGRFMLADMTEHPCRVSDLSIDGVTLLTEVDVAPIAAIIAYIEDIGRFEGTVVATVPGGIRISFRLSTARRHRLASQLDRPGGPAEQRRHRRQLASDSKSHITLADGRVYACEVIDISLSGAALRTAVLPSLGTFLDLGRMRGRVVRYHESGIAIEFLKRLAQTTLQASVND